MNKDFANSVRMPEQKIKIRLAKLFNAIVLPNGPQIIVASSGRAGSTVLHESIKSAVLASTKANKIAILRKYLELTAAQFLPRLSNQEQKYAFVIKTHDTPRVLPKNTKIIFIHADPLEAAVSAFCAQREHGDDWINRHLYHLGYDCPPKIADSDFSSDIFLYERQISYWHEHRSRSNVLILSYENLWDNEKKISDFLNLKIKLPPKMERNIKEINGMITPIYEVLKRRRMELFLNETYSNIKK